MTDVFEGLTHALASRYTIERELGRGGMATVYLAEDLKHHRKVAIKVLRPELAATLAVDRFSREIEIAAKLVHPHILPVLDSGSAEEQPSDRPPVRPSDQDPTALPPSRPTALLYYVMPYVEGESLRDRMNRERQLPVEDALQLTQQVASALSYAHEQGVIHRDIKPENIMLSAGGALVADFGIARAVTVAGGETLTETGMAVGTPAYMSPEQATAEEVDGRTDIYSLGCVLYEMLAGDAPYLASTPQAVIAKKLSEPTPHISVVRELLPPAIDAVLIKALAKSPADRFATVEQFAQALVTPSEGMAPTQKIPAVRLARRRWMMAGGAVTVAVIVAVISVLGALPRETAVSLNPNHVVVGEFRNVTGDPSLGHVGERTGHWITQGIQQAAIPVIPWDRARGLWDFVQAEVDAGRSRDPIRLLAEEAGVGTVIAGAVYLEGDTLEITVDVTDAAEGRLLGTVGPVVGTRGATREVITEAQQRVMGFLAMRGDERRSDWEAADWARQSSNPPTFDAWQAMQEAPFLPVPSTREQKLEVIEYCRRAAELDSTWVSPLMRISFLLFHLGRFQESDSVLTLVEGFGERLTPYERADAQLQRARLTGDRDLWYRSVLRVAELSPAGADVFNSALWSFKLKNRPAEAIEILESIGDEARFAREYSAYWGVRISAHHNLGEHSEALELARHARTLNPDWAETFLRHQAVELAAMGRVEELQKVLDELEAVTADEDNSWHTVYWVLVRAVETLRANEHSAHADEILDRTMDWLNATPYSHAEILWHRQKVLVLSGRYDEAQVILDSLVEQLPDAIAARGLRGFVSALRGDTARALDDARKLEQYVPDSGFDLVVNWRAYYRLAIFGALGEDERVVEMLADAADWWDFESMPSEAVDLDPIRDHPAFQELIRPKG
jgi:tetratricopeptide (TPR) repeat protein